MKSRASLRLHLGILVGIALVTTGTRFAWREREGLANEAYLSRGTFWIIHYDAIEPVYELALRFWHKATETGLAVGVDPALGYAMQPLCADPAQHEIARHPQLWASQNATPSRGRLIGAGSWQAWYPPQESAEVPGAAIFHWARGSGTAPDASPTCPPVGRPDLAVAGAARGNQPNPQPG